MKLPSTFTTQFGNFDNSSDEDEPYYGDNNSDAQKRKVIIKKNV
jgi:hypothetical protein